MAFAKAGGRIYHAGNYGNDAGWVKDLMANNGIDMSFSNMKDEVSLHFVTSQKKKKRLTKITMYREMVVLLFK